MDEDALNVLLAEGMDYPTAYAAAQRDQPKPPAKVSRWAVLVVVLIALAWMVWK